jgi:glyoxylase-like metal-dependent hydrolase (beta-lactamase superfamily II)/uncharacterized protein YndB with AHSA1/START domain
MTGIRVHHLNCAHLRRLSLGGLPLACHVLLVETPASGLVLVDTGLGTADYASISSRLGWGFAHGYARPAVDPALAAIRQVAALGFDPRDVRHIAQTHLDLDHVGGLSDFPWAAVHVHRAELAAALARRGPRGRARYRPPMWSHGPRWRTYSEQGDPWYGFGAVRSLAGLPGQILAVPLIGHTPRPLRHRHPGPGRLAARRRGRLLRPPRGARAQTRLRAPDPPVRGGRDHELAAAGRQPGPAPPPHRGAPRDRRLLRARPGPAGRTAGRPGRRLICVYSTRVSRHVNAARPAVYRALVDAGAIAKWRVPDGMSARVHEFDAREGGAFRISLSYDTPAGTGKSAAHTDTYHGHFVRLVPDEQVVEVFEFETADPGLRGEMTMTTTLTDAGGGTDVLVVHEGIPDQVPAADNETGTRMALASLARLVEAADAG